MEFEKHGWEYLGLRGMTLQEGGENCLMRNFIMCTVRHMFVVRVIKLAGGAEDVVYAGESINWCKI
jgi:hypothetical protein